MSIHKERDIGKVKDLLLWKKMMKFAMPYWRQFVLAVALAAIIVAATLAQPYLIKVAIDEHFTSKDVQGFYVIGALFLLTVVASSTLTYVQTILLQNTGQRVIYDIRQKMFSHLSGMQTAYFDRNPVGRLVTRIAHDVEALNQLYSQVIVNLVKEICMLLGIVFIMFNLHLQLSLVAFTVIPVLAVITFFYKNRIRDAQRYTRLVLSRLNSFLAENLAGMRIVQIFVRENKQIAKFDELNEEHYRAGMRGTVLNSIFNPTVGFLGIFALALIVWYGGKSVLTGAITFGIVYAFTHYVRDFFQPIMALSDRFNQIQTAMASAERIFELLDERATIESPSNVKMQESMNHKKGSEGNGERDGMHPIEARPVDVHPVDVRSVEARPVDVRSGGVRAVDVHLAGVDPVDVHSVEARPAEVHPVDVHSVEARPAEVHPADVHSVEARPAEVDPVDVHPVEARLGEQRLENRKLRGEIEFSDVWFAYNPEEWVLRNISFHVKPGETIAFVGATGAGKSSIIQLMNRFYDADRGDIRIDGISVKALELAELRRSVGVIQQDTFVFTGNVMDNIRLHRTDITDEDVKHAAYMLGIDEFIRRLPEQYDTLLGEQGIKLSSGQQQLLAFLRAYVYDPDILILDEATSHIDTETELLVQEGLKRMSSGRTTLIVAHRLSTIRHADKIIVLHKGEIQEVGTHDQLLRQGGMYRRLHDLQNKDVDIVSGHHLQHARG